MAALGAGQAREVAGRGRPAGGPPWRASPAWQRAATSQGRPFRTGELMTNAVLGQSTPGQSTPGQSTPGQSTPGQSTPGQSTVARPRLTRPDFKVADLSLAEFGRKEIRLAEHEMPGLMAVRREYADAQPLAGARITGSLHM